jgi:cytochrome c biogenesis protein CcmG/thiol:disulfide interchange protein DsbE
LEKIIGSSPPRPICSEALRSVRFALLAVVSMVALPALGQNPGSFESEHLQRLDEAAPDFLLRDASGNALRLGDLRGHPIILHFWATWCKPCRAELPTLEALTHQIADSDIILVFVAIDTEADEAQVRRYVHDLGVGLPVYLARAGTISDRYWSWGVPVTYLIDREGRLVARALGPRNWASASMRALITQFAVPVTVKTHISKTEDNY